MKNWSRKKKIILAVAVTLAVYGLACLGIALYLDNARAVVQLNGEPELALEYGQKYEEPGAVAWVEGSIFGVRKTVPELTVTGAVDDGRVGSYTVEYSAVYRDRQTAVTRHVTVEDNEAPVIELKTVEGYQTSWFTGYEEEGFSAVDNYDGDITDRVQRDEREDRIVYTVSDSSGNTATVERRINYDTSVPRIYLNGETEQTVSAAMSYVDPGYRAEDASGSDLTDLVEVSGEVIPYTPGTYELTYTIRSERGDSASLVRRVTVEAVPIPETVKPDQKTIYLTFDDGPGPYTDRLLDVLEYYGVKATFFVTGCDPDYNDCIGRAYREGHSIGIHTMCHDYGTIYSGEAAYFSDFQQIDSLIYEQTGTHTNIFRFPGGSSNTVSRNYCSGVMTRLTEDMTNMGYKYFDWNVDSDDAGAAHDTETVVKNVTTGCQEYGTCVVLQHDVKSYSVEAVEQIILWGRNNGYQFKALDNTSYGAHHYLNN